MALRPDPSATELPVPLRPVVGDPPPRPHPPRIPSGPPRSAVGGPLAFLKRHPVLCLLLLSPGIPEYLSSSSSLTGLLISPVAFFAFLGLNLGLYGPGVLLIREAAIRWNKGWATILTLGAAYAILEEGVALSTFFNSYAQPVGTLGFYGHWLGVSWVWVSGLVLFHSVFSIFVPILLLGLALPETRGRALLSGREITTTFSVLLFDLILLIVLVRFAEHFWLGVPLLAGSLVAIAGLILVARVLPKDLLAPLEPGPTAPAWALASLGVSLFPCTLLSEALLAAAHAPPVAVVWVVGLTFGLFLFGLVSLLGTVGREHGEVALALGCLVPVMVLGFLAALPAPAVIVADALAMLFFWRLWKMHPEATPPLGEATPPGETRTVA